MEGFDDPDICVVKIRSIIPRLIICPHLEEMYNTFILFSRGSVRRANLVIDLICLVTYIDED